LAFLSLPLQAQNNNGFDLESDSDRCVALRQGQTCYKKIHLQWTAQQTGNYCLVELQTNITIQCWQQQSQAEVDIEFESTQDLTYVLRRENDSVNLAETVVKLSWVYEPKPNRSSGWRLF
jgi:hypothetical protein